VEFFSFLRQANDQKHKYEIPGHMISMNKKVSVSNRYLEIHLLWKTTGQLLSLMQQLDVPLS